MGSTKGNTDTHKWFQRGRGCPVSLDIATLKKQASKEFYTPSTPVRQTLGSDE